MKKLMINAVMIAVLCAVWSGFAVIPTAEEIKAARQKLELLTKNDYKALKEKKKTEAEVGDALMEYVANEEKAPAKFALFQDAFAMYVKGKAFDKADDAYSKAQVEGGTEYALEVAKPTRSKLSGFATSKNPTAKELKARIDEDDKAFKQVRIVRNQLKKNPGDETLCEKLGLEYAAVGDWDGALAAFQTAPGEFAKIADWELGGGKGADYTAAKVADFWWKLAESHSRRKNVFQSIRLHAAMWYRLALDQKAYSGNDIKIIENLIAETEAYKGAEAQEAQTTAKKIANLAPIVLQLNGKKNVIEFIGCPAGEFEMGKSPCFNGASKLHSVKITRPFWLGKFPITWRQWGRITGDNLELTPLRKAVGGVDVPVCDIAYWKVNEVCAKLTKRYMKAIPSGYVFRLPTDAEWEYALKANCNDGNDPYVKSFYDVNCAGDVCVTRKSIEEIAAKSDIDLKTTIHWQLPLVKVGTKRPNAWGFCDMLGNGAEYVLDTLDRTKLDKSLLCAPGANYDQLKYANEEVDPLRFCPKEDSVSIARGCENNWKDAIFVDDSAHAFFTRRCDGIYGEGVYNGGNPFVTFRLCIGPDLMKENGFVVKKPKK